MAKSGDKCAHVVSIKTNICENMYIIDNGRHKESSVLEKVTKVLMILFQFGNEIGFAIKTHQGAPNGPSFDLRLL